MQSISRHSPFGPSAIERALLCTASVYYGQGKVKQSSKFADEGSVGHQIMDRCISEGKSPSDFLGQEFELEDGTVEVDGDMVVALEHYLDYVRLLIEGAERVEVEVKLGLPGSAQHGTCDLAVKRNMQIVVDLKYGAGIFVPANTKQLGNYLLMILLRDHPEEWLRTGPDAEVLGITVVGQPRGAGDMVKPHGWTRGELVSLYDSILGLEKDLRNGVWRYHVSEKCRFCPGVVFCPALAVAGRDIALANSGVDPDLLLSTGATAEKLDALLEQIPAVKLQITALTALAYQYLENGGVLSHASLVPSRAKRTYEDEGAAEAFLRKHGVEPYEPRKLLSPAKAEAKLGPKKKALLAPFVHVDRSGHTLSLRPTVRTPEAVAASRVALNTRSAVAARLQAVAQKRLGAGELTIQPAIPKPPNDNAHAVEGKQESTKP